MVYKVLSSSGIEKYLTKMTVWVSQQNQRRKANETSKNEKIKHCAPGDKKLKLFQKRKKAGFLQEEKESPRELDLTLLTSPILEEEGGSVVLHT